MHSRNGTRPGNHNHNEPENPSTLAYSWSTNRRVCRPLALGHVLIHIHMRVVQQIEWKLWKSHPAPNTRQQPSRPSLECDLDDAWRMCSRTQRTAAWLMSLRCLMRPFHHSVDDQTRDSRTRLGIWAISRVNSRGVFRRGITIDKTHLMSGCKVGGGDRQICATTRMFVCFALNADTDWCTRVLVCSWIPSDGCSMIFFLTRRPLVQLINWITNK